LPAPRGDPALFLARAGSESAWGVLNHFETPFRRRNSVFGGIAQQALRLIEIRVDAKAHRVG